MVQQQKSKFEFQLSETVLECYGGTQEYCVLIGKHRITGSFEVGRNIPIHTIFSYGNSKTKIKRIKFISIGVEGTVAREGGCGREDPEA